MPRLNNLSKPELIRRPDQTKRRFKGHINQLMLEIARAGLRGEWTHLQGDMWQFRLSDGAVLNFWPSTSTINIQGPAEAATQLEARVRAYAEHSAAAFAFPSLPGIEQEGLL